MLVVLFCKSFCLFLQHFNSYWATLFKVSFICWIYYIIVFSHFLIVFSREYSLKTTEIVVFILISERLSLSNSSFSLFPIENLTLPRDKSILIQLFCLVEELVFSLSINIHDFERILNQVEFDFMVKRSICGKTWRMVNFQ